MSLCYYRHGEESGRLDWLVGLMAERVMAFTSELLIWSSAL